LSQRGSRRACPGFNKFLPESTEARVSETALGKVDEAYGQNQSGDAGNAGGRKGGRDDSEANGASEGTGYPKRNLWAELYRIAGFLGVDPSNFTFRELAWMSQGRLEQDWWHTSHLLALHVNMNRRKGTKTRNPKEFHPFLRKEKIRPKQTGDITWLKALLPQGHPARKSFENGKPKIFKDGKAQNVESLDDGFGG
tara:strand:- start:510 stop:1097 length:588 start_codon:yes stop_codon:yes gene_type:complete